MTNRGKVEDENSDGWTTKQGLKQTEGGRETIAAAATVWYKGELPIFLVKWKNENSSWS
jgi:hypothetical protein